MAAKFGHDKVILPTHTNSTREATPASGSIGYNSDKKTVEIYSSEYDWVALGIKDGSSPGSAVPNGQYLADNFPDFDSGWYWIQSEDMPSPLRMYVDMTEEGGGFDFYPIQGGTSIWVMADTPTANAYNTGSPVNDGVALGLDLVYPRSKYHWRAMSNFVRNVLGETGANYKRYFHTAYAVYRTNSANAPTNGGPSYVDKIMRDPNYYGTGAPDWHVPDYGRWWLRDTVFTEPNGDYHNGQLLSMMGYRVDYATGALSSANSYVFPEPYNLEDLSFNDIGSTYMHATGGYYLVSTNAKP